MPAAADIIQLASSHGYVVRLLAVAETDLPVLRALESAWTRIRADDDLIPAVTFELQPGRSSGCGSVEWDTAPVITLNLRESRDGTGNTLPATEILATLLHQAGHAIAAAKGSASASEGRYHGVQFGEAASKLGLAVSDQRIPGIGYAPDGLAPGSAVRYRSELQALQKALDGWEPEVVRRRDRSQTLYVCSCTPPRKLRMSKGVYERGPVTCGICGQPFRPEN